LSEVQNAIFSVKLCCLSIVTFFKHKCNRNSSKLTRGKREVDVVSDCGDKNRCAFIEMPSGDRIRIRLLFTTIRQNLKDFKFRSRCERGEIRRCCRRRRWVWRWCGGVTRNLERDRRRLDISLRHDTIQYLRLWRLCRRKQSCRLERYLPE